jgi:hypothetical protein
VRLSSGSVQIGGIGAAAAKVPRCRLIGGRKRPAGIAGPVENDGTIGRPVRLRLKRSVEALATRRRER